ncbi:glycogen-binding subunit 76A [Nephila pilipes]|uniref:Glycogen-binding subunit 76A n=1 Tax=Nephila pilipes TaxID=299642 RepID=A0A8X6I8Q8_NEPPI|nr:glycogen-binding subunit 76A [Nephila pilipes]
MLKRRRVINTCSLSSCRLKAEALARVFNSRIWPCTWIDRRRAEDSAEEDEEYFEASPAEDEDLGRQSRDSSAATVEGRAKLFELLQQHATGDDATEVYYDVSEHVESDGNVGERLPGVEDGFEEIKLNDLSDSGNVLGSYSNGVGETLVNVSGWEDETVNASDSTQNLTKIESPVKLINPTLENSEPNKMKIFDCDNLISGETNYDLKTSSLDNDEIMTVTVDPNLLECDQIEIFYANDSSFKNSLTEENHNNEIESTPDTSESQTVNGDQDNKNIKNDSENNLIVNVDDEELKTRSFEKEFPTDSEVYQQECNHVNETESFTQENDNCENSFCDNDRFQTNSDSFNHGGVQENESISKNTEDPISIEITSECKSPTEKYSINNENFTKYDTETNKCRLNVFDNETKRPMISRSTSLKTGKTPPGTPSRKKIVRFADVLGLDLEDVRHIISGDLPNIPSSAFSDLVLPDEDLPVKVSQSVTLELKGIPQSSWENVHQGAVGLNIIYPLFSIPGQQPDFMDKIRNLGVCLESVIVSDFNIQCTCRVMNWGFSKTIAARYTMDGWKSSSDINASYVPNSTRDGTDCFAFNIFLPRERCNLEFALRYNVNDREYWDNNGGKNYCLGYHSNNNISQTPVPTSPTWMHQFW